MAFDPLTCQELVELVTDYLEEGLSHEERQRFEAHLLDCSGCRAYVDQMRKTIQLTKQITPETMPPQIRDELLNVFRQWKTSR